MTPAPVQPAGRFEWERIVRRCRIGKLVKLVGFTLAQYGDEKGQNIRPGVTRLAAVCEMGESTVRRYVDQLIALGLLERLSGGGGRNHAAAVYRLTIPEDLLERVPMLDPDERTPLRRLSAVPAVDNSETASNSAHDGERSEEAAEAVTTAYSAHFGTQLRSLSASTALALGERPPMTTQTHQGVRDLILSGHQRDGTCGRGQPPGSCRHCRRALRAAVS